MPTDQALSHQMADAFQQVASELQAETDRGAVILAFAWMDEELTRALKKFFRPSPHASQKTDELFGPGRPIGDAATKIDVAYRLGLIHEETLKSLHVVRRLRNDFAHISSRLTFETDSVRDRVQQLFELQRSMTDAIFATIQQVPEAEELLRPHATQPSPKALTAAIGAKALFAILAGTMVSGLMLITSQVGQVTHPTPPVEA